jgi:hypothetical protein
MLLTSWMNYMPFNPAHTYPNALRALTHRQQWHHYVWISESWCVTPTFGLPGAVLFANCSSRRTRTTGGAKPLCALALSLYISLCALLQSAAADPWHLNCNTPHTYNTTHSQILTHRRVLAINKATRCCMWMALGEEIIKAATNWVNRFFFRPLLRVQSLRNM